MTNKSIEDILKQIKKEPHKAQEILMQNIPKDNYHHINNDFLFNQTKLSGLNNLSKNEQEKIINVLKENSVKEEILSRIEEHFDTVNNSKINSKPKFK